METIEINTSQKTKRLTYERIILDILNQLNLNDSFYTKYKHTNEGIKTYQYYQKGKIIEKIEQYIQKAIPEYRDINEAEIIDN